MIKKTVLLSMLSLCAAIHTSAQNDEYVYITNEISGEDFPIINNNEYPTKTITRGEITYNSKAHNLRQGLFEFVDVYGNPSALVTTQNDNNMFFLKSIEVNWASGLVELRPGSFQIYGKNNAYTDYKDLTDDSTENDGELIGAITYKKTDNLKQKIEFAPTYHYWGLKKANTNVAYITSLSITWQLIYNRANLTPGNLGTLCLPYSIKAEDMGCITAYTISGKVIENGEVTSIVFDFADHIEAGKPYLFVANSEEIFLKYYGNKMETPGSENGMHGVFERHPFAEDSNYNPETYYVITKNNTIQRASSASGVNANCAFIKMDEVPEYSPAQSNGRNLILTSEGFTQTDITPTLLNTLPTQNSTKTATDISGRRIANSTIPAITVHNGKKILTK